MKVLPDLRKAQHGRVHPAGQDIESNQFADRQIAIDDQLGAEIQDARGGDLADELHDLACGVAEAQNPEAGSDVAGKLLFPAALHLRLDRHGLECLDAGDALDQERLVLRAALEFLGQPLPEQRRHPHRNRRCRTERCRARAR